jgi:aryl-alcohol dehydrogenase-like predicted oxidoreductase
MTDSQEPRYASIIGVSTRLQETPAMNSRREFLINTSIAAAGLGLASLTGAQAAPGTTQSGQASAAASERLMRPIPRTGERIPAIGMGTSGSFEVGLTADELAPLREVLQRFFASGATVIDTAPTYGSAEDVLGELLAGIPSRPPLFLATKLSGVTGRDAGLAQFQSSLRRMRVDKVELLQVHNLRDTDTQLAVARELQQQGKVRYVGLTHYLDSAQAELAQALRRLKPDFVQINYSVTSRTAEQAIFPVAQELGIAVMINRAFDDGRLFARVKDKPLPAWAAEVGATSWAQLLLKFVLSHPAVTVVIPATSKPKNMTDNLLAGTGPLLDARQRADLVAQLG